MYDGHGRKWKTTRIIRDGKGIVESKSKKIHIYIHIMIRMNGIESRFRSGQCRCSIDDRFDGIPDAECFVPSNLIFTFDRTASRTTLSIIIHPLRG